MLAITNDNFDREVKNSTEPVLVDFYADWCPPCRMLAPILERISGKVANAKVGKVNIDENQELAKKYNISSLPTLLFFKNGNEEGRLIGMQNEAVLQNLLEILRG